MAFLKAILIILLIYYLFKILAKWFAPKLFSYAAKRTEKHFREKFEQYQQSHPTGDQEIGDISIDKKPNTKETTSKNVGEYIDFEEIE